jgi:hypothetical protein
MKSKKPKATSVCQGCDATFEGGRQFCTPRCKKTHECRCKGTTKFLNNVVAPLFQRMIRAEYGAEPSGYSQVIRMNALTHVYRHVGQCACVTCGKVDAWDSGIKGIHTGHFLASRRASILLEPDNVAPQCSSCNFFRDGAASEFRQWMEAVRGSDVIERLSKLKTQSVSFSRDELVDRWFEYSRRVKAAKERMTR